MAMTKAEKAAFEALLTESALRYTAPVDTDVTPPDYSSKVVLSKGYDFVGEMSEHPRVDVACSSSVYHAFGSDTKTSTQGSAHLYSTKLKAVLALRNAVEKACARRLRYVDKMIESIKYVDKMIESIKSEVEP